MSDDVGVPVTPTSSQTSPVTCFDAIEHASPVQRGGRLFPFSLSASSRLLRPTAPLRGAPNQQQQHYRQPAPPTTAQYEPHNSHLVSRQAPSRGGSARAASEQRTIRAPPPLLATSARDTRHGATSVAASASRNASQFVVPDRAANNASTHAGPTARDFNAHLSIASSSASTLSNSLRATLSSTTSTATTVTSLLPPPPPLRLVDDDKDLSLASDDDNDVPAVAQVGKDADNNNDDDDDDDRTERLPSLAMDDARQAQKVTMVGVTRSFVLFDFLGCRSLTSKNCWRRLKMDCLALPVLCKVQWLRQQRRQ